MKKTLIRLLITFFTGLLLTFLFACMRGLFSAKTSQDTLKYLCDGFFFAAVCFGCSGFLMFSAKMGTFDMLFFGTRKFFKMFSSKQKIEESRKETFVEYREKQAQKKASFSHLLINCAFFLIAAVIFLLIYYAAG